MTTPKGQSNEPGEAPFIIEELFFSRTDQRGVILSGNSIFRRVSSYSWDELINSPHKLIRHPDMPKAVFHLLWDSIKAGNPIGAYVKNRSKTGEYYWVFAFVTPIEGGYLSVRLKPSTPLFQAIVKEYATLREAELDAGLSAEDSAALLLDRMQELGWRNYASFLAEAAVAEVCARDQTLSGQASAFHTAADKILKSSTQNQADAARILRLCDKLKNSAINLSIQSAKHATHHKLFQVISSDFARVCEQLKSKMEEFITTADGVFAQIDTCLFLRATALIQQEMAQSFCKEGASDGGMDHGVEIALLENQSTRLADHARSSLRIMEGEMEMFQQLCAKMLEHVDRLGVTGTIGLIETARQNKKGAATFELLQETSAIQEDMETTLRAINARNIALRESVHIVETYQFRRADRRLHIVPVEIERRAG